MSSLLNSLYARFAHVLMVIAVFACAAGSATGQTITGVSSTAGDITTVAGNNHKAATPGVAWGDGGAATSAMFKMPLSVAFDSLGNLYIGDRSSGGPSGSLGDTIRKVDPSGTITTFAGGGTVSNVAPSGGTAIGQYFSGPSSIAVDSTNNLYFVESANHIVDRVDTQGNISVVAGMWTFSGLTGDGGAANTAKLNTPQGVAVDPAGNIYIADSLNHAIRLVYQGGPVPPALTAVTTSPVVGNIYTLAGTLGTKCASATTACGDGGSAVSAQLDTPYSVSVDSSGDIYIVDQLDYKLRVIYGGGQAAACLIALENPSSFGLTANPLSCQGASSPTIGSIYTIAGTGKACATLPCGENLFPTAAAYLAKPQGLAVDPAGNVFFGDVALDVIREINAQSGLLTTVAGTRASASTTSAGDGGAATSAKLSNAVAGIAFDSHGNLFIADTANFNIRAVAQLGTIPLTPQTITFNSLPGVTYGADPIKLEATSTNTDIPITYSVTGSASLGADGVTLTITGAGTVNVTANQAGDATHSAATPVPQSFTVGQATITVTATNFQQPQGTALPTPLPYAVAGLVSPDMLNGTPSFMTSYTTSATVGQTFNIQIGLGSLVVSPTTSAGNYTFSYVNGQLTVGGGTAQTITFTPLPASITYGDKPIPLAATSSAGLPISYTATGSAVVTGTNLAIVSAGSGTVTASQPGNATYSAATPATQIFTANRAPLTVTATSFSQSYGTALPSSLPYTVIGLVGSDSLAGSPTFTTAYTPADPVGTNDQIVISQGTLTIQAPGLPGNYSFSTFVPGNIKVVTGTNTISFPTIPVQSYGNQAVTLQATASSGLPVTFAVVSGPVTLSGNSLRITGAGTAVITATQSGNPNYAAATPVTQTFVINPAVLTVQPNSLILAPGATFPTFLPPGAIVPTFPYTINGFVNNDTATPLVVSGYPTITTTATPNSGPGTYSLVITLGTLASQNYTFKLVNGTITITSAPAYVLTASPSTIMVQAGHTAQASVLLTPVNQYQGTVTLSCGQLPINLTCTFSPATLNLTAVTTGGNTGSVSPVQGTLTINTNANAPVVGMIQPGNGSRIVAAGMFLIPSGLGGLLLAFNRKRLAKYGKLQAALMVFLSLTAVMGLGACGSSNNSSLAATGTNTVMITATGTGTPGTGSPNTTTFLNVTVNITE